MLANQTYYNQEPWYSEINQNDHDQNNNKWIPGFSTEKEKNDYICNYVTKESNINGLPKIHNCFETQSVINSQKNQFINVLRPTDLKLRPIVPGLQS